VLRLPRLSWFALALSFSAFAAGCTERVAPGTHEVSVHEYLFGAFGGGALDARDLCPSGSVEAFEIRRNAGAYFASIASLGLYLPHQVRVRCSQRVAP
jgi:hypothetical protein